MTAPDYKLSWREHLASQKRGIAADFRIGIAATMTAEPLVPYLGGRLLEKNFQPDITVGPFNQLRQLCQNHGAFFGRDDINVILVIWRLEDMFAAQLARCLDDATALPALLQAVAEFTQLLETLRRNFTGTLIVSTPPYPVMPGFEALELGQAAVGSLVYQQANLVFLQKILKIDRIRLLDSAALMQQHGAAKAFDARKWQLYRQPYTEAFWQDTGIQAARILAAEKTSAKKCIVLDLDNTLWGGIVGEDGLQGIALGEDFPGRAFRDFQRHLMHLKSKGIMLAVASKNNPEDALEVFDKHDAMILLRKDITAFEISWDSKVDALQRIAKKLNIGLDALVFVDDNPKEIGEVNERLPMVTTFMVPEELADLPCLLSRSDLFDIAELTDEDRRRTEMMSADIARQSEQSQMSEDDFRKSLELKIEVFATQKQHLARVTQLINKTNQFNLTTRRRTQSDVEALAMRKDALVLGMDIKDKYGDYGLVGVAIIEKQGHTCLIDTLLMSCRVLGRGAETTFLAQIAAAAKSLGCSLLRGTYIETPKNAMVKDFYSRFGFKADGDGWSLPVAEAPAIPDHLQTPLTLPVA